MDCWHFRRPNPMHAGIASSPLGEWDTRQRKWVNGGINVNYVNGLIEKGLPPVCASARASAASIDTCVGNKWWQMEWPLDIINKPELTLILFLMLRLLFFFFFASPYFLPSISALITHRAAVLHKSPSLPPLFSCFCPPESCLFHLFSFPSALKRHISTLDGESRDGVGPWALIGILVLWQLPHYCGCHGYVVIT